MNKLILFDFDGVILDSWQTGYEIICQIADCAGIQKPKRNFVRKNWGATGLNLIQSVFPDYTFIEQKRMQELFKNFNNQPLENRIKIMEYSAETLIGLKNTGNKIGLCTNRSFRLKEHLEKLNGVEFDIILSCDNPAVADKQKLLICENHFLAKFPKPDKRFFEQALNLAEKLDIAKEKIFFIGDTLVDFEGARNAGINFIGVLTGAVNTKKRWWKWGGLESIFIVNSIADLPRLLD